MSEPIRYSEDPSWGQVLLATLFEYQTLKIVNIGNKKIGFLNRLLQLSILAYILG